MSKTLSARAVAKRDEILEVALRCFREEGFQGTGISAICKKAGMSPGHLYHYFESKEAIVEAIVEADRRRIADLVEAVLAQTDVVKALLEALTTLGESSGFALDPVLTTEIVAESARNARIAEVLTRFDRDLRMQLITLLRVGQERGQVSGDIDRPAVAEAILIVADGLITRTISHPDLDRAAVGATIGRMVKALLDYEKP